MEGNELNKKQRYDAVIADPDTRTRMLLKQATSSVLHFGTVNLLPSLAAAISKLNSEEKCDVVFVSYKFNEHEIRDFITQARNTKQGEDAAYILVAKPSKQDSTTIANQVMIGTDGFLFEPYSVESLIAITELAARVRKERSSSRQLVAIEFVINEMINHLDLIAYSKSMGLDVGPAMKKIRDMSSFLLSLEQQPLQLYFQLIVDILIETPVPNKIFQRKKYTGASTLVRKKLEQKLLSDLEAGLAKIAGKRATLTGCSS